MVARTAADREDPEDQREKKNSESLNYPALHVITLYTLR